MARRAPDEAHGGGSGASDGGTQADLMRRHSKTRISSLKPVQRPMQPLPQAERPRAFWKTEISVEIARWSRRNAVVSGKYQMRYFEIMNEASQIVLKTI